MMLLPKHKKYELIEREELIEELYRSDCSTREKIEEIVRKQPAVAVLNPKYEIEVRL